MQYKDAVDFLYSQLPMFQRSGKSAYKVGMGNIEALCEMLDNPHKKFKTVHVAGTNGKGSSSHMLAAIFQSAGYKTGLFTSPHLKDFRERVRVNGKMIPRKEVIEFVDWMQQNTQHLQASFFEMNVALAFDHFAKQKVDIAIIETGLGGRLDSTNIITPELSLITNIGFDHMDLLGDTLDKIAMEKAGIIKHNIPVVISEYQAAIAPLFKEKAMQTSSEISFASDSIKLFDAKSKQIDSKSFLQLQYQSKTQKYTILSPLTGVYQTCNIAGVIGAMELLQKKDWQIKKQDIEKGIAAVIELTGIKGRWQQISNKPRVICDTGHNLDGIEQVLYQLKLEKYERLHFVLGMVGDKDVEAVMKILPKDAFYYYCAPSIPRAMPVDELFRKAEKHGLKGKKYKGVRLALKAAKRKAKENDLIFVGGSTFVVAEVV
jgi:dihydrofolate synthase/folylpolyglutamate synthase